MNFVSFVDPWSGAFHAAVPAGWQVDGGCRRVALGDIRLHLLARSPEGIVIQFRDPQIPAQMIHADGFQAQAGTWVPLPTGAQLFALPYLAGVHYARTYAVQTMGAGLSDLALQTHRERPDLAKPRVIPAESVSQGIQLHTGEVTFHASRDGVPLVGACLATTVFIPSFGASFWGVEAMISLLAPADRSIEALNAAFRLYESFRTTPNYHRLMQQDEGELSANGQAAHMAQLQWFQAQQQFHQAQVASYDSMNQSWWDQQRHQDAMNRSWHESQGVYDRLSQNYSDATMDRQRLYDPSLGEYKETSSGYEHYWRSQSSGEIIGTNIDNPPFLDVNFTKMQKLG